MIKVKFGFQNFGMFVFNFFLKKKNFKIRYFMQKEWERIINIIMMLMVQFFNEDIWIKIEFFLYNVMLD